MKIAIFVDRYGTVLPFFSLGVVEIYSDESGAWKCINQVPMDLSSEPGMNEVLRNVRMLASELDDCNLLVLENIQGIVRSYLSDYQIGIWKYKGLFLDENLLNHIKLEVEKVILEHQQKQVVVAPVQVGKEEDAVYELDLATLIDCDVSLSSRAVLIPFFQTTNFRELIIICKQSPKWLEQSLELLHLSSMFDELGDGVICLNVTPLDFETGLETRKVIQTDQISTLEESCSSSGCASAGSCVTEIIKDQQNKKVSLNG
jgi:Fe-only nitrogenase accessory protein AnfO